MSLGFIYKKLYYKGELFMLITTFKKYLVHCRDTDSIEYHWHLDVLPGKKSWEIAEQKIESGMIFKGFFILSIEEKTSPPSSVTSFNSSQKFITKNEFDLAVDSSDFTYAVSPSFSQSYRCHICQGVVANGRCSNCMFDWDS